MVGTEDGGSGDQWLREEVEEVEDGEWTALYRLEAATDKERPPKPAPEFLKPKVPSQVQPSWLSPLQWLSQGARDVPGEEAERYESEAQSSESTVPPRGPSSPPLPRFKLSRPTWPEPETESSSQESGVVRLKYRPFQGGCAFQEVQDAQDSKDSETSQCSQLQHWQQQANRLAQEMQRPTPELKPLARGTCGEAGEFPSWPNGLHGPQGPMQHFYPDYSDSATSADSLPPKFARPRPPWSPGASGSLGGLASSESSAHSDPQRVEQLQGMLCHQLSELVQVQQAWYKLLSSACRQQQEQAATQTQQSFYHRPYDRGARTQAGPCAQSHSLAAGYEAPLAPLLRRPDLNFSQMVPTLNPWTRDSGKLLAALGHMGAVYITDDGNGWLPHQSFERWRDLWHEALLHPSAFRRRLQGSAWQLRFSQGEDLLRTLQGHEKLHTPDVRYNFGLGVESLHAHHWGDLKWLCEELISSMGIISSLVFRELAVAVPLQDEPPKSLGYLLHHGIEQFAGSRMRHSVYPFNGSCTEHTDYGVVTFQQSTAAGLQGQLPDGRWVPLHPPASGGILFAGDMLERMTNGQVRALVHRVCLEPTSARSSTPIAVRQSHILFLQPDRNTVVRPLRPFCTGNDLPPVRYGDWHKSKTSLAFAR
ncbi:unnamed protein product [Symbiodinium natans]|uniref:Isopenicillin N synthase-like Fe(2+) 2OG dioxygenase domain-containing protein n=1 Tax=Symbiodinium natans TaxID=878477 RepID=A0A812VD99_9DINO|nr:unnamed protein product [Symbiodinium natans]